MLFLKNNYKLFSSVHIVFILIFCNFATYECKNPTERGLMDNINSGLKYASQLFGINTAADVANLVSKAFSSNLNTKRHDHNSAPQSNTDSSESNYKSPPPRQDPFNPLGFFTGLVRLMGFDNSKLGALAINGIILIAQMIGNMLSSRQSLTSSTSPLENGDNYYQEDPYNEHQPRNNDGKSFPQKVPEGRKVPEERKVPEGSPIDWLLENPSKQFLEILEQAKDRNLPERLAGYVNDIERKEGEADCVKLLLCKSAPFIWGMQKSILKRLEPSTSEEIEEEQEEEVTNEDGNRLHVFFKYLPDVDQYKKHGYFCENRYKNCNLTTI